MPKSSDRPLCADQAASLPTRLVIAPHIQRGFFRESTISWSHGQWNLASHLMGWTDWRLAASQDWHGLAVVIPELTASELYNNTSFEEAWHDWAIADAGHHQVAVTVRDEYSTREFEFGNQRPQLHATVNVFTKEYFEYYRMEADPDNTILAWEHIFTTMMPGCDINITGGKSLEEWLADDEVSLPDVWMNDNTRPYKDVVVLDYAKVMVKPVGFKLELTSRMPLRRD